MQIPSTSLLTRIPGPSRSEALGSPCVSHSTGWQLRCDCDSTRGGILAFAVEPIAHFESRAPEHRARRCPPSICVAPSERMRCDLLIQRRKEPAKGFHPSAVHARCWASTIDRTIKINSLSYGTSNRNSWIRSYVVIVVIPNHRAG